ncbi:hypothetical protein [Nocardioides sp. BYT-33-1]|uniref:hypothetical protein n=1 Tax=Nocardioides sp. BYT-33-1 TaxID=3416952 RepID=UPI003F53467B
MSWAIGWVLKEPRKITDQDPAKANRFCFEKKFGLPSPNGTIEDRYVVVLLGKTGVRIMTTFPRKTAYCKGDVLLFNP